MTNNQLGMSQIEKDGIFGAYNGQRLRLSSAFLISRGPLFNFVLKVKKLKQNNGVLLKSRNCGKISVLLKGEASSGEVMEKEFEFKPSFDEYLKAMESVKSVREKRKQGSHTSPTRDRARNGGENGEFGDLEEGFSVKKSKLLVQNRKGENFRRTKGNGGDIGRVVGNGDDFKENGVNGEDKVANNRVGGAGGVQRNTGFEGDRFRDNKGHLVRKTDDFRSENVYRKSALQNVSRGRGSSLEVQSYDKFEGESFRDSKENQIRKRDRYEGERPYAKNELENVTRGRGRKGSVQGSDDEEMDRAAFKSLEKYNDFFAQPRVSKADTEERIQTLAKW